MTRSTLLRRYPVFLLAAALAVAIYFSWAQASGLSTFPLDDAWIHQGYARNLSERGEWSFQAGRPSAGATSFLWVLLLAPGHLLNASPQLWVALLGVITLAALGTLGSAIGQARLPGREHWSNAIGLLLVFEWHMVWAALSGMETLLFATFCLAALAWMLRGKGGAWLAGVLVGLAALLRPEGVTLLGPLLLGIWLAETESHEKRQQSAQLLLGFVLLFGPYLLFNYQLAGQFWPNTFYAKQAEYAVLLEQPILARLRSQLAQPLIGVGILLLPGLIKINLKAWREKYWPPVLATAWALGFLGLFALRLPVTYQHGRYAMPAMPIFLVLGSLGLAHWLKPASADRVRRLLSRAYLASVALVLVIFYLLGGQAYRQDVAFIEGEMVVSAVWIKDNLPEGALIAAHDIGALGYFAPNEILDLAGLVSPEVVPFIRDESRLADYLDAEGADYLLAFPGWYPELVSRGERIFSTDNAFSLVIGGENLSLYRWRKAP